MSVDPNYLKMISDRLDKMNGGSPARPGEIQGEYKLPNIMDQMGQTAMAYLNRKKEEEARNLNNRLDS
jgi:hypothetical protein